MVLFARSKALLSFLLAAHFGGQAYAWLVSIGCAVHDPAAYPGLVAMTLSAGAAFAFALRTSGVSVLWGPFRFGTAASSDPGTNWRRTVAQTAGMWAVFLVAVPGAVVVLESVFRWRQPWSPAPAVDVLAGLAFIAAGATGLWAGKRFCVDGDGTPLPSDGTRRLVVSGPYRYIRNPMALFGILQGVCIGVVLRSPLVVTYAVVGGVWWDVLARPLEERYLADTFGDDYGEYRDRVRCWIPHLSALRARSLREGPKCGR
ncbi:MAG: isoprenylcysteine carboxylmethyltransferase family protein [Armatimonadetes bacterium]|nr:isoprenylcysteine carboxylmethyltransferase family protein [Armatimonadota bacterium]